MLLCCCSLLDALQPALLPACCCAATACAHCTFWPAHVHAGLPCTASRLVSLLLEGCWGLNLRLLDELCGPDSAGRLSLLHRTWASCMLRPPLSVSLEHATATPHHHAHYGLSSPSCTLQPPLTIMHATATPHHHARYSHPSLLASCATATLHPPRYLLEPCPPLPPPPPPPIHILEP